MGLDTTNVSFDDHAQPLGPVWEYTTTVHHGNDGIDVKFPTHTRDQHVALRQAAHAGPAQFDPLAASVWGAPFVALPAKQRDAVRLRFVMPP